MCLRPGSGSGIEWWRWRWIFDYLPTKNRHLCCVCRHFWYIHALSGTSQPCQDSEGKVFFYKMSFFSSQRFCCQDYLAEKCENVIIFNKKGFPTWAEKNSPSRRYVGWKYSNLYSMIFGLKYIWIESWIKQVNSFLSPFEIIGRCKNLALKQL